MLPAWITIGMLKKAAPWVAGVLIIFAIYFIGYNRGTTKWHGKYDSVVTTARQNAAEVVKLEAAIEKQSAAVAALEQEGIAELERVEEAHKAALAGQAASYRRAIEQRDRDAAALRERVRLMSVAETCHEAWVEVAG